MTITPESIFFAIVERKTGIEPVAYAVAWRRSTSELLPQKTGGDDRVLTGVLPAIAAHASRLTIPAALPELHPHVHIFLYSVDFCKGIG